MPLYKAATGGSPGGSDTQVQFNDSSSFGGDAGLTYNKTTNVLTNTGGGLVVSQGTITDPLSALSITATWNDAADTFYGIFQNITNTNSASASRLLELQVGGAQKASVTRDGWFRATVGTNSGDVMFGSLNGLYGMNVLTTDGGVYFVQNGAGKAAVVINTFKVTSAGYLGFTSGDIEQSVTTALYQNAAGVVEVNNGTAGTYRDILVRSIIIDGAPSTAGAGQIAIGADTRTTIGANGGASALTANPVGYIDINVAGSSYQIPYYSRGA